MKNKEELLKKLNDEAKNDEVFDDMLESVSGGCKSDKPNFHPAWGGIVRESEMNKADV